MGNQIGSKSIKINLEMSNAFQQILKCPSQVDLNNRLNILLNGKYQQSEWVGSILSEDIRQYYHEHCQTVEKILEFAIDFLYDTTKTLQKDLSKEHINVINNCLRIIVKIMPVIYENQEKMVKFLWHLEDLNYSLHNLPANQNNRLKVIRSNDAEIEQKLSSNLSWGIKLISSLESLCFFPQYTICSLAELDKIPKDSGLGDQFNNQYLWTNIMKTTPHLNNVSKFDENRILVLSAILTCISSTLYVPAYGKNYLNPWITYLTSPLNQRNGLFFINLLFYTLSFKSQIIDRINHHQQKRIALLCSQIAYSILCHHPVIIISILFWICKWLKFQFKETVNNILEVSNPLQQVKEYLLSKVNEVERNKLDSVIVLSNGVINYLQSLKEEQSKSFFKELTDKLFVILEQPLKSENSLFLNSLKDLEFEEEAYGILPQLLYFCPSLYKFICSQDSYLYRLFKVSIYQFCKSLDQMNQNNTYFVSMTLLTILSNNTSFSKMLNSPKNFNINLRFFPIIDGTLADLLICCCAQAIINNKFNFSLCNPFNLMIILKNISPYVKNLSCVSCQKLNQLITLFTQMDFLLQNQHSPLCIVKLIQIFDYILGYNFDSNIHLVYEIHQRQETFSRLPKINFQEQTLRSYYQHVTRQSQQKVSNAQNNKKIEQISSDNEQNKMKQSQNDQNKPSGQTKEKELVQDKGANQEEQPKEKLNSSMTSSEKKRPSRVVRKKEKKPSLKLPDAENVALAQNEKDQHFESDRKRKNSDQEIEIQIEKEKDSTPIKEINVFSTDSAQKKERNSQENQENQQNEEKNKKDIIFFEKKQEDLFVEKWKNLDWSKIYSTIPLKNLSAIIKNVNEFVNNSLKKSRFEVTYEIFASEKSFLNNLQSQIKQNPNIILEQFSNFQDILSLSSQCCWMQIVTKSELFPSFERSKILFFRVDIPPLQVNLNDQQINVEFPSSNALTEQK